MSSPSLEECSMCGIIVKYNIYPSRTILKIIGTIGTAGGTGYVIEYTGDVIKNLSMEGY